MPRGIHCSSVCAVQTGHSVYVYQRPHRGTRTESYRQGKVKEEALRPVASRATVQIARRSLNVVVLAGAIALDRDKGQFFLKNRTAQVSPPLTGHGVAHVVGDNANAVDAKQHFATRPLSYREVRHRGSAGPRIGQA